MQTLADDARTTTPLAAADVRTVTPPPAADARAQGYVGDVGAPTSPPVIDVDPIIVMPGASDQDLIGDPTQVEQAPKDPDTSGAQVPGSSS
jgi:hypothetical protein